MEKQPMVLQDFWRLIARIAYCVLRNIRWIRNTQYAIRMIWVSLMGLSLVLLTACGQMDFLAERPLPTPVATAQAWDLSAAENRGLVVDPTSDVVPGMDADIAGLVTAVSQQQLMGYVQTLSSFGTRNTFSVQDNPNFGIGGAREWLYNEFLRVGNGRLLVQRQEFPLYYNGFGANAQNIVAILPGSTNSSSAIVITAHYDNRPPEAADGETLSPGANDNATGVALLLESARVLSSREWRQTIIFVATAGEEQETQGARHFVQQNFLSGYDVVAAINYDGIGGERGIPQFIRLFAPNLNQSLSGELARYYEYIAGLYVPMFPIQLIDAMDRDGRYGDQREFINAGLPAIRFTQSVENPELLNSKQDTWDRVDYDYLQQVVQMNVAVLANLAGAPDTPEVPLIRAMDEPGMYRLNWPVDPAAAGYAIAFRPIGEVGYPVFRFVRAQQAGDVALTGLDGGAIYAVSIAALDEYGRLGDFTREVIVDPAVATSN
jgi:hypothetical protein